MKHPAPNAAGTSAAHWKAAGEKRLALPYCASCARFHWPVRVACPHCGQEPSWRDVEGTGRIASFSVVHRAVNPELKDDAPYVVAFIELDERVRIFSNVVDVDPQSITTGMRVRCRFEGTLDPAVFVPVFAPEKA
jgi:uncharacterized protein